jgi:hypothetical protein
MWVETFGPTFRPGRWSDTERVPVTSCRLVHRRASHIVDARLTVGAPHIWAVGMGLERPDRRLRDAS